MATEPRTLILSDTHLGRPGRVTVDALRPMWKGFDRLIINGDAAELQLPDCRTAAARALDQLQVAAERDAVELILISGNHDAYISDHRYLMLLGGRVLLTHGDVLHPSIVPWSREAKLLAQMHAEALDEATQAERCCIDFIHDLSQHLAYRERMGLGADGKPKGMTLRSAALHPIKVAKVLNYWRSIPRRTDAFVQRYCPQVETVILGHTHRQGVWQTSGRTLINTGSYDLPGRPRAVIITDNRLAVRRVRWAGEHYALCDRELMSKSFERQSAAEQAAAIEPHRPSVAA